MKRLTVSREIAGIPYTVRTLLKNEIGWWLIDLELMTCSRSKSPKYWLRKTLAWLKIAPPLISAPELDMVDLMLFDDPIMFDIRLMTNLTPKQIGDLTPRQTRQVWAECKAVNGEFWAIRKACNWM